MGRVLVVVLVLLCGATEAHAQWQKATVCGGSCGGGCGPCNTGGGNAAPSAPAQPSAWLRNRQPILEKRGVVRYDRCVAEFTNRKFDDAVEDCRRSLDIYVDAFGSPASARGHEASQGLAAAENARAVDLFGHGRCDEAAALFRAAAEHDPGTGAYGRNAILFTPSACAAASGARFRSTAPPPPAAFVATAPAPIAVATSGGISAAALDVARDAYHRGAQLVADLVARHVPGGELAAQISDAAELRKHYNELVRDLVNDATGSILEAAEIGGHGGDAGNALGATDRGAHLTTQFAADETAAAIEARVRVWAASVIAP